MRNKTAAILAIVGGIFILVGGGTGMAGFLSELREIVKDVSGDYNETLEMVFWVLILIAALGGLAVIIGGLLFYTDHITIGKILIALGAGIGVIGLVLWVIISLAQGGGFQVFSSLATSFLGIGIVLSIVARMMAKS